ncbi:signal recognition particle-docking protein FtsY [Chromobacterium violaceum]|uniref:Signal recognition particle receptor FtsY n=1 Tax=Chromobacterium violaceum (strain ATCC 12472 / DSM 30191 / JCM 1249 / CCUG 213 / NBRC 12614 / NCIMB 9131 / NCTC 9757 / MK) TaxID=243365 RepID=Q7NQD7_CHRVO|nr:signal recognition particle-docking protein FtsY [Chromobacterium violaceum]AAQ61863.1 cell division protein FtsY [Chromobacterium violaceum ATCC 12472]SUX40927.1 Cell division protein FtsY homolog [Chromobacterium violaceum]
MFSFFKKKTKPAETPQIETPALLAPEQAPAAPETIAPVPEPQREPVAAPIAETAPASAEAAVAAIPDEPVPLKKMSWTERLKAGLAKTRDKLGKQLAGLFGGGKIDEDLYEELETVLLTADMGMDATEHLLQDVRERVSLKGLKDSSELKGALKDSLQDLIGPLEVPLNVEGKKPFVIMMTGVNGAGKTTSIGKLAKYYQSQGKSVLLAAGDTFRAAAREQLIAWGERNNVTVIAQQGGDSAAVCYDAIQAAIARGIDIVLADTAGRLPTQLHLMEEIKKVKRVIQKALPDAPHEVVLVLDANIGQNTVNQVKAFDDALGLTGLILTKLDGTAKGGVIAAIAKQRPIPLRFVGVGESIDDLRPFDSRDYIDALFE